MNRVHCLQLRAANKTMLRILGLFNPFPREVAEMHYLWTAPVALDDSRLRAPTRSRLF